MEEELGFLASLSGHENFSVHPDELLGRARLSGYLRRARQPVGIAQVSQRYDPLVGLPSNTLPSFVETWHFVPEIHVIGSEGVDPRIHDPVTFRNQQNHSGLPGNAFSKPILVETVSSKPRHDTHWDPHPEGMWTFTPGTMQGPEVVRKFATEGKRARPITEEYLYF